MSDQDLDFIGDDDAPLNTHGGARKGAGRKPKGHIKSKSVVDFESARARNEAAKADLNELDHRVKSGQYVSREALRQAAATILQSVVQSLRSVRDNLERRGVPAPVCEDVHAVLEDTLSSLGTEFEMMSNSVQ